MFKQRQPCGGIVRPKKRSGGGPIRIPAATVDQADQARSIAMSCCLISFRMLISA